MSETSCLAEHKDIVKKIVLNYLNKTGSIVLTSALNMVNKNSQLQITELELCEAINSLQIEGELFIGTNICNSGIYATITVVNKRKQKERGSSTKRTCRPPRSEGR